jgi:hypothetical protein
MKACAAWLLIVDGAPPARPAARPPVSFESWLRPAALRAVAAQRPPAWMHATLYVCRRSARPRRATCKGTLAGLPALYVFRVDGRRLTLLDVR